MADSYLVKGAKIKCLCGSQSGELGVENKNVCLLNIPVATEEDCKPGINIPSFGICSSTGQPCIPKILGKWLCPNEQTKVNGSSAITTGSALVCGCGGLILSETSGQGDILKIFLNVMKQYQNLFGLGCSPFSGDPVNLNTGNYVLEVEDLGICGNQPLTFTRTYNSLSEHQSCCGIGWNHNHDIYLSDLGEQIEIHIGEGGQVRTFDREKDGCYVTNEMAKESLSIQRDGYVYRDLMRQKFKFNKQGQCIEWIDENKQRTTYTYQDQLLVCVSNVCGTLRFSYNDNRQLTKVVDHTGRTVLFQYENGNLIKAGNFPGGFKQYEYDEAHLLIGEISPYGVRKVENTYDSNRRAVKQVFADGGTMSYEYNDPAGKVTMILQNRSKYHFYRDKWHRDCKITSHNGQTQKRYNDKNQLTEIIDTKGNTSNMEYDDAGNLISISNPLGDTTVFEYNRSNQLVKTRYPDGAEYQTEYNSKGQIIKIPIASAEALYIPTIQLESLTGLSIRMVPVWKWSWMKKGI